MLRDLGDFELSGRRAALVSVAATLYFFVAAISSQLLNLQYDFFRDYISDYAIGPRGWIYGSAFWASCIGSIALAIALAKSAPASARSRTGVVLLAIVGVTYAIDYYYPTEILAPGARPKTIVGLVHLLDAGAGWILFAVSAILLSSRMKRDPYWRRRHGALTILAWIAPALLVVLVIVVLLKVPFGGLAEKAFILDRNLWTLLAGLIAFNA